MRVGLKGIKTIADMLDRPAEQNRDRGDRKIVGVGMELYSKGAADIGSDHAHLVAR